MFRNFPSFSRTCIFFLLLTISTSEFRAASASSWLCFSTCPYCRKFSFQIPFDNAIRTIEASEIMDHQNTPSAASWESHFLENVLGATPVYSKLLRANWLRKTGPAVTPVVHEHLSVSDLETYIAANKHNMLWVGEDRKIVMSGRMGDHGKVGDCKWKIILKYTIKFVDKMGVGQRAYHTIWSDTRGQITWSRICHSNILNNQKSGWNQPKPTMRGTFFQNFSTIVCFFHIRTCGLDSQGPSMSCNELQPFGGNGMIPSLGWNVMSKVCSFVWCTSNTITMKTLKDYKDVIFTMLLQISE